MFLIVSFIILYTDKFYGLLTDAFIKRAKQYLMPKDGSNFSSFVVIREPLIIY